MQVKALKNLIHDQTHRWKDEVFTIKDEALAVLQGRGLVTTDLEKKPEEGNPEDASQQAAAQNEAAQTSQAATTPPANEPATGAVEGEDQKLADEAGEEEGNPEDEDDSQD